MPSNVLIANDGQIEGPSPDCDPALACWQRANAIFVCLHEGFRQGQAGLAEGIGDSTEYDCEFLASQVALAAQDLAICDDLLTNGVPVTGPPSPTNCPLLGADKELMMKRKADAEDQLEMACAEMRAKMPPCDPIPPECPPQ
jgi:hypothetical protein